MAAKGPRPRKAGTLPKELTPDVTQALTGNLALGMNWRDSALHAGISESSVHKWRAEGAAHPGTPLGEWAEGLTKARLTWRRYNLGRIASAARGGEKTTRTVTKVKKDRQGNVVEETTETVVVEHAASWQAAAWILERLAPADFARVTRLEAFQEDEGGDTGEGVAPNGENVASILDRIAERQRAGQGSR